MKAYLTKSRQKVNLRVPDKTKPEQENKKPVVANGPMFYEEGWPANTSDTDINKKEDANAEISQATLKYPEAFGLITHVTVMDIFGKIILDKDGGDAFSIDQGSPPGIYFASLTNEKGEVINDKIIKDTDGLLNVQLKVEIDHAAVEKEAKRLAGLGKVVDAAWYVINKYGFNSPYLTSVVLKAPATTNLVITTEGNVGAKEPHLIRIPSNLFDFNFAIVVSTLAHECFHVQQRTGDPPMLDHNEREFQAYYENVFHEKFSSVPEIKDPFYTKQFAEGALKYYNRMDIPMQMKYNNEALRLQGFLNNLK